MLVLARKFNETICIGDNIRITVVDIRSDKVRIGIDAPKSMSVHREEIWKEIQKEKGLLGEDSSESD